jgi:hypothetical protein
MNDWWESKRLLVWLLGVIGTSGWGVGENAMYIPTPDVPSVMWLSLAYILGQSVVDAARALKGGAK